MRGVKKSEENPPLRNKKDPKFYEFGTPELRKKFFWKLENVPDTEGGGKRVRLYSHPIDMYYNSQSINRRQHEAAVKIASLFSRSSLHYAGIASWSRPRVDGGARDESNTYSAQENFFTVLGSLSNDITITLIYEVCCFGTYVRDIDLSKYYKNNISAMTARLREALDELADVLGIPIYAEDTPSRISNESQDTQPGSSGSG